jgi:branched-chain amino acid aminotransferase
MRSTFRPALNSVFRRFATKRNDKIDASKIVFQRTTSPMKKLPEEQLLFGRSFSDHMLTIDWSADKGWENPVIHPYGNLSISPASSALHYGIECFEGMKAFKDAKGTVRLFRPDCNMNRLKYSMERLAMPTLDMDGFLDCIKALLKTDEDWIPTKEGYSMYIRPTAIGTSPFLGVQPSEHIKLFVILSPVGPYFKDGFKPVSLLADTNNVRAWPGGAGNAKVGGNYAPTIAPARAAAASSGVSQILWLFGPEHTVTEVGAMNIFFLIKKKDGKGTELITAPLTNGDILPGVTRRSILELTRQWGEFEVNERWITMKDIVQAGSEGRLLEAFGAGTAAVISPVKSILYQGENIEFPVGSGQGGEVSLRLWKSLYDIQYGKTSSPWSVPI